MFNDLTWLGEMASLITSLTVVGGALLWAWEKLIGAPRAKARMEIEREDARRLDEAIKASIMPLRRSIDRLTEWLEESKRDRENLNRIQDETIQQIGNLREDVQRHEVEITVLKSQKNQPE